MRNQSTVRRMTGATLLVATLTGACSDGPPSTAPAVTSQTDAVPPTDAAALRWLLDPRASCPPPGVASAPHRLEDVLLGTEGVDARCAAAATSPTGDR
jgi:hypothetical protein